MPDESTDPRRYPGLQSLHAMNQLAVHHALGTCVELRLPTLLVDGPRSSEELAGTTGAAPAGVDKVLRLLALHDVVRSSDGGWALGPLGELLTEDHPFGAWRLVHPDGVSSRLNRSLAGLGHAVRTGTSGYEAIHGRSLWADLEADPELGRAFGRTMVAASDRWLPALAETWDWTRARAVLDVGGGLGNAAIALLRAHPHLHAVVLDRPHLADDTRARLADAGLADRAGFAPADFFAPLPVTGDTALLIHVIHDWEDDQAVTILRRCADAVAPDGRVLLVECVRDADPDHQEGDAELDLLMYVLFTAEERTEERWRELLDRAGLRMEQARLLSDGRYVLECVRP